MIEFEVDGLPSAQGSKTAVTVGGKARVIDKNPKSLKAWRDAVEKAARAALPPEGGYGQHVPVIVQMIFRMPRGKTVKRALPTTAPDLDKTLRSTNDAMTKAGVYYDDSQIVESAERKRYVLPGEVPGVRVRVSAVGERVDP
ncbi:RusA family crossover junction endodeoxyribonuclease [Pseudoclavibacter sp. AY1H1]|uniref:RusA family crossover junction endodeoxyribonuclease n=1 Tax=Pseudoclavibacter sp. AY1H1 TaxID=2080584 RepID=UPI0015E3FEC9|nr:RusA family crossover junction endodeoxyribonuclease [Pseudoclavibacter sp. AY1H1]